MSQWHPVAPYLDTASFGLPPDTAWTEFRRALDDWRGGRTSWERWGESTERARRAFARLHGVSAEAVAIGATVYELVGLVAAAAPDGSCVLGADGDFASLLFPWAAHDRRGVSITTVPLAELPERITAATDVVVVSLVQSATGELAPLDEIVAAARAADALVVVDATQACGWLPFDAARLDALACAGYKWLLAPRGTAYLYVGDTLRGRLAPIHAGWCAAEDIHGSYYGLPPRLAASARRFDTSPAWFSWVGAAPALELLEEIESSGSGDTTSSSPTAFATASGSNRATRRSSPRQCRMRRHDSSAPASARRHVRVTCAPRFTSTTRRRTSTRRSKH